MGTSPPPGDSVPLDAVLISLRDPHDAMALHEIDCFKRVAGLDTLRVVHASGDGLSSDLLQADLLFFGGSGAYSVLDDEPWVRHMLDFLVETVHARVPSWASCFGFQGLALAMGGVVERDDSRQELGAFPITLTAAGRADPVLGGLPERFHAQLGHHDHVMELPQGVTQLATGDDVHIQAFKVDGAPFWGAQFHPELDKQTTYARWIHYKPHYDGGNAEAIDKRLRESPETPEVCAALPAMVRVARELKAGRG